MSQYEANTAPPSVVVDPPPPLPSLEETENALAAISPHRDPKAAAVLRELAEAIIRTVCEHEQKSGISTYLAALTITCKRRGDYSLAIHDRNSDIDPDALAKEIADAAREDSLANYGKLQRPVTLDFGVDEHG